jgi:hypothetical protein
VCSSDSWRFFTYTVEIAWGARLSILNNARNANTITPNRLNTAKVNQKPLDPELSALADKSRLMLITVKALTIGLIFFIRVSDGEINDGYRMKAI